MTAPSASSSSRTLGDNLNRLTNLAATHVPTSTPITNFGYQYDAAGNRTQKSTLDYTEDYGYDPLYRLTRADRTNPGATPPNQWTWNYDAVGNRTSAQKDQEATTSTHNEKNQLLQTSGGGKMLWRGVLDEPGTATFSAASASINGQPARMLAGNVFEATLDLPAGANTVTIQAQDGSGNVSSKSYSVNVLGVPATYTYDANGNLATKTEGADAWVYTWNALNQLTAVTKNSVSVATYKYDPGGRRVERVVNGNTTSWAYDGEDLVRQGATTPSPLTTTFFVAGPGVDEPMAEESGAQSAATYLHVDGLGSIVGRTNAAGALADSLTYDPWGNVQSGNPTLYSFTGREWDPGTAMYYYRARFYDQRQGRFISEDPTGFAGGYNFYGYALDQPTSRLDPFGEESYKPGVPPAKQVRDAIRCIEACVGRPIVVTSTDEDIPQHPPGTPHRRGVAADMRYAPGQGYKYLCCAGKCGAQYAKDEAKDPSAHATAPHFHVQLPRGLDGGRGHIPDECVPGNPSSGCRSEDGPPWIKNILSTIPRFRF